jgi:hypothetical protein
VRKSARLFSRPHGVRNRGGETPNPCKMQQRILYMFTRPSYSSHTTPSTPRNTTTVSKMGHTIVVGLLMLRVRRRNPPVKSELLIAIRVRGEATHGVASSWHI